MNKIQFKPVEKKTAPKSATVKNKSHKTIKSIGVWSDDKVDNMASRMQSCIDGIREQIRDGVVELDVKLSGKWQRVRIDQVDIKSGNSKLGKLIHSVSLPPVLYCKNCKACKNSCYDLRHDVISPQCMFGRCVNAALLEEKGSEWFMGDLGRQIAEQHIDFVRYNIGGDVQSEEHFRLMVQLATSHPAVEFLLFTKMFHVVNRFIYDAIQADSLYQLPANLHVIFSEWPGLKMQNPFNMPTSFPVYEDEDIKRFASVEKHMSRMPKFYWHCGDDCTACALSGEGCWKLKRGESVGFNIH